MAAPQRRGGGGGAVTYQSLVDDAQHEDVVQEDVSGVLPAEADVGDGRVPLQPQVVQPVPQQRPAPLGVFLLHQRVLEDLQHTRERQRGRTRATPAAACSVPHLLVGVRGHQGTAGRVDGDGGGAGTVRRDRAVKLRTGRQA